MSMLKIVFVFGVLAVSLSNVLAMSTEEKDRLHEDSFAYIIKCSEDLGISMDDLKKLEKPQMYDSLNPCVLSCLFKKNYLVDDKGLFDIIKTEEFINKYLSDEADRKKAIGIISKCKGVNDLEVTDGVKGCERSKATLNCIADLTAMFFY